MRSMKNQVLMYSRAINYNHELEEVYLSIVYNSELVVLVGSAKVNANVNNKEDIQHHVKICEA